MYLKASTLVAAGVLAVAGTPLALHMAGGSSKHGSTSSWIKTLHGGGDSGHGAAANHGAASSSELGTAASSPAAIATPQSTADLTGKWNVTVEGTQGTIESVLTLKQDGKKLTGTFGNPHGAGDLPVLGERDGDKIVFAVEGKADHGEFHLEFSGAVKKDDGTLAGTMKSSMGESKFLAKRVK